MYEIAICDDDGAFAAQFEARISQAMREKGASCHTSLFSDPDGLLDALEKGMACDLIFLDILFGAEKGLRFARLLREKKWDVEVVFVTVSPDFAVESFAYFPLNYLLKPVEDERIEDVVNRFLKQRAPRMLRLTMAQDVLRVPVADVLYFEIYSHTSVIHLRDGATKSWFGTPLSALERLLPPGRFVRPHRSYLVNLEHVASIMRYQMKLSSGDVLPISKKLYREVQTSLVEYDDCRFLSR